jgi:hypothetical protein
MITVAENTRRQQDTNRFLAFASIMLAGCVLVEGGILEGPNADRHY